MHRRRHSLAVTRFARETGDIHALSAVDLKLLALAHTLEVAAHGPGHLKEHPNQVCVRACCITGVKRAVKRGAGQRSSRVYTKALRRVGVSGLS
jgi:rRNA maturation endonuclease Nob1